MNINDAIKQRRSVKHFDSSFTIPQSDIDAMLDLACESPSSFNIQHWRIVNVTDKDLRQKMRDAAWNQAQVTDASHLFVICADVMAFSKNCESYWHNAPDDVKNMMVSMMQSFYHEKPQLQRDEALRSVGLFAQTLMLSAKSFGYDSCPMIGFDSAQVAKLINLPDDYIIGMMLPIGKTATPARPKGGYIARHDMMTENHW